MPTYDVEFRLTMRVGALHMEDAKVQALLTAEEQLYGEIMMPPPGELSVPQAQVDERIERTGVDLRVVNCERVVTGAFWRDGALVT